MTPTPTSARATRAHSHSRLALATPDGEVVESYEYEPYGLPTIYDDGGEVVASRTSTVGNRFMFTGREWDEVGEFYHYRHRTYSPFEKRFMQRDPIGLVGGWNVYAYCGGDPVNASDPMGLSAKVFLNPATWFDSDGSERLFEPSTWFTVGSRAHWMEFGRVTQQAYVGRSNGFLSTFSFGAINDYTDYCNPDQAWGHVFGAVSAHSMHLALAAVTGGSGAGVNFRAVAKDTLVPVTAWAPAGVTPTVGGGGGWVMLGEGTTGNYVLFGFGGGGLRSLVNLLLGRGGTVPFRNHVTQRVAWKEIERGILKTEFKRLLGQGRVSIGAGACK